jgi:GNAT superfamily N-acetyltransferase
MKQLTFFLSHALSPGVLHSRVVISEQQEIEALEGFLAERIYEFNSAATGYFDGESFGAAQRDEHGNVVAGITGYTWGGCCYVSHLWVSEAYRGRGVGASLLKHAESQARMKGCTVAILSSHSFQSPAFYAHHGYRPKAVVEGHPPDHSNVFLTKILAEHDDT